MEKKEYIEREKAIYIITHEHDEGAAIAELQALPAADVVQWSWLEQYATGKRCNFASEFVSEARKEWENGTTDRNV